MDAVLGALRNEGGMRSTGRTAGGRFPTAACSHRCMAKTNSSQPRRPSESMSDRALEGTGRYDGASLIRISKG